MPRRARLDAAVGGRGPCRGSACSRVNAGMSSIFGSSTACVHRTLSARAARIACSSRSATTPTKLPLVTTRTFPRKRFHRGFVDTLEPRIGHRRPDDSPVQQARHAQVLNVGVGAEYLARKLDPRNRLADDGVPVRRFRLARCPRRRARSFPADQLGVGNVPAVGGGYHAVLHAQLIGADVERRSGELNQGLARLGGAACAAAGRRGEIDWLPTVGP